MPASSSYMRYVHVYFFSGLCS